MFQYNFDAWSMEPDSTLPVRYEDWDVVSFGETPQTATSELAKRLGQSAKVGPTGLVVHHNTTQYVCVIKSAVAV